jgi:hypothetical protein
MLRSLQPVGACLGLVLVVGFAGCGDDGPPLGTVTGQVTMDGKPLENALVTFIPEAGGGTAVGQTDANGNYTLATGARKGALVGTHKVAVTTVKTASGGGEVMEAGSDAYEKQAMGGSAADYNAAATAEPIPTKYNSATTLQHEVTSGRNVINLELTSS